MGFYPPIFPTVRSIDISSAFYFSKDAIYNSISHAKTLNVPRFFVHVEYTEKQTYCDAM